MRNTGKQPIKPTPSVDAAIMLFDAGSPEGDQERDEEDISDTRDYQLGTREFRQAAAGELDEREPAPVVVPETRENPEPEIKEPEQDHKAGPKPKLRVKSQRPSKAKWPGQH